MIEMLQPRPTIALHFENNFEKTKSKLITGVAAAAMLSPVFAFANPYSENVTNHADKPVHVAFTARGCAGIYNNIELVCHVETIDVGHTFQYNFPSGTSQQWFTAFYGSDGQTTGDARHDQSSGATDYYTLSIENGHIADHFDHS